MKRKRKRSNMSYHLFLDDDPSRIPHKLTWIELPLVEWTVVRSYDEFVKTVTEKGIPHTVSFDHDLGTEHYQEYARVREADFQIPIDYSRFTEKTGMDCAKWLAERCIDKNVPLPEYYVHTMNGPGRLNIVSIMESARKVLIKT
jgi:hypothetical protein